MHPTIQEITGKIERKERISLDEGQHLLENSNLLELGKLASIRRHAMNDERVSYVVNMHINCSNLCLNNCHFCAYRREEGDSDVFELTPEEVWERAERMAPRRLQEFHVVSSLNPNQGLSYYETVLRGLRERFPKVHIKAFTAVEINHLANQANLDIDTVLQRLMKVGVESLTGGGAETLSPRVRQLVCPEKLDGEGYLDIHRRAHKLGIKSTATLLFGHVEAPEERLDHLCRLRQLQDETGGFTAFVPLVFHPANTRLDHLKRASARSILEMLALSRILLDNFPHIKAYWVSIGPKLAQVSLAWGADDLDGTVAEEQIHHSAGAQSPQQMTARQLRALVREAGLEPFERDAVHKPVVYADDGQWLKDPPSAITKPGTRSFDFLDKIVRGERRMTPEEAEALFTHGDLLEMGQAANAMRQRLHPEPIVTYAVDRNINTTNECLSLCSFCAFACETGSDAGWTISREEITKKIDELVAVSDAANADETEEFKNCEMAAPLQPQILMQGGMSPHLDLAWYEDLFRWMQKKWPTLHIHALSPPEIRHLATISWLSWHETIRRLKDAGLASIPGGGAEILNNEIRANISPRKGSADEWIGIMRAAHEEGLRTSATMVIGLGETAAQRAEHFERVRSLQDETAGFTAFIPWTFQPGNTELGQRKDGPQGAGAWDYLRTLAIARLYLDNVPNLQASWVTQGRDIAQIALLFGANDLGSTMLEENVVAAAGTKFRMGVSDLKSLTEDLGMTLQRRNFFYQRRCK